MHKSEGPRPVWLEAPDPGADGRPQYPSMDLNFEGGGQPFDDPYTPYGDNSPYDADGLLVRDAVQQYDARQGPLPDVLKGTEEDPWSKVLIEGGSVDGEPGSRFEDLMGPTDSPTGGTSG